MKSVNEFNHVRPHPLVGKIQRWAGTHVGNKSWYLVMVNHCVVVGCSNYVGKKPRLHFSRFPSDRFVEKRARWIAAVRREKWTPGARIVSYPDRCKDM